ncbi:MAG: hypothetical protein ABEK59_12065 [Halobacteria archaeon]
MSELGQSILSGIIALIIGSLITLGISQVNPTPWDLTGIMTAVATAAFFGGFFGRYFSDHG